MPYQLDPEGNEPQALFDVVDLRNARVLEIGSGHGRLVSRYAHAAAQVIGIEPNTAAVAAAGRSRPRAPCDRVTFIRADAVRLPFRPAMFDVGAD